MECLLDFPPLHLMIMDTDDKKKKTRMSHLRLQELPSYRYPRLDTTFWIWGQITWSSHTCLTKSSSWKSRIEKLGVNPTTETGSENWSDLEAKQKIDNETRGIIYSNVRNTMITPTLGNYAAVFQAETYAIFHFATEIN